ncbi:LysR family transcriptional regulator [Methylobrevis pamukkalensis]|uniref:HTH-type transcriptional regulator SyrM 1 n=1 Tax=Methylobrevis pamukkalensis TaxID=1439726 RepID=A0A1E3H4S0_9HYPH|nr:LysR family transcriptional regulator [Methylobrevis pamukkalensis]ODN71323.1 HTH-type transcriptional regulator SyrM 1 [Methylobrevis pamukkalensis]
MRPIDDVHIRRLDMSLLIVFDALLRSGRMSEVAREQGLTQSAVSHAVGRMREIFRDPLFVRNGSGVTPTPRARQLAEPIREAISAVRLAVRIGHGFDPAGSQRNFVIAAVDSLIAQVAPGLLRTLSAFAPGCRVSFVTLGLEALQEALAGGAVDLAVGAFGDGVPDTSQTDLYPETFLVVVRRGNPRVGDTLDLDLYCTLDHVLVSLSGNADGKVDAALTRLGRRRRVALVMPQFIPAFTTIAKSDAIMTAPSRVCRKLADLFDLRIFDPPLDVPGFRISVLRHRLSNGDPAVDWLETQVRQAMLPTAVPVGEEGAT